jgi:hypothetical protein
MLTYNVSTSPDPLHPQTHPKPKFPIPHYRPETKNKKIKKFQMEISTEGHKPRSDFTPTRRGGSHQPAHASFLGKDCQAMRGEAFTEKSQPLTDEMRVTLLEAKSLSAGWRERTLALASIDPSQAHRDLCCVLWEMECSFWEDDGWHQITI